MEKMSGRARWIKVFLESEKLSSVHIFPDAEFKSVSGSMYRDCDWEFSDGVFKLTGTRKHWCERGQKWRRSADNFYGGWENEPYALEDANNYENPKHTTATRTSGMWWWKKIHTFEVWENGNYLLKAGEKDTFVFTGDMAIFMMEGERVDRSMYG